MSDGPKIVPDPPPAPPVGVRTSPDPGPTRPFDVVVTPDPGPRAPFDVPVFPDAPPAAPFDVGTVPDPGPRSPVDVKTTADPGPRPPTDVPTVLDPGPRPPFQVPTTGDPPPRQPVNVAIVPDPPPRPPFQVPTVPDLPPVLVNGGSGTPTIQAIIEAVGRFDRTLGTFLGTLLEIDPVTADGPGAGALDPRALVGWLRDYTSAVGSTGVIEFLAEQAALYGMNSEVARIFDPSYFLKMLVPGSMGHVRTTVDVEGGLTMQTVAGVRDALLIQRVSATPLRPDQGDGESGRPDTFGPENTLDDGQDFTVDEMVDAAVDGVPHPYLSYDDTVRAKRFDASKYFESRSDGGAMLVRGTVKNRAAAGIENVRSRESALAASAFIGGVVPSSFPGEDPDGAVYTPTPDPSGPAAVDDDEARVPLCFTDLRRDPTRLAYRSIYLRPLNLALGTGLAPEYQENSAFGRTDPTVAYMRTTRTVNLSFELHAFSPEDVTTIYNKLTWLQSMCYPSYTADSLFQSGPVVRLRIGDVVGTSSGGMAGVIRNLGIDFSDALWELRRGMKVPRSCKVQVDFLCLHDGPVGLLGGQFGVLRLPPPGSTPDKDTNDPGGPTDSRDTAVPGGPSLVPGGFARFGEPARRR